MSRRHWRPLLRFLAVFAQRLHFVHNLVMIAVVTVVSALLGAAVMIWTLSSSWTMLPGMILGGIAGFWLARRYLLSNELGATLKWWREDLERPVETERDHESAG